MDGDNTFQTIWQNGEMAQDVTLRAQNYFKTTNVKCVKNCLMTGVTCWVKNKDVVIN